MGNFKENDNVKILNDIDKKFKDKVGKIISIDTDKSGKKRILVEGSGLENAVLESKSMTSKEVGNEIHNQCPYCKKTLSIVSKNKRFYYDEDSKGRPMLEVQK